MNAFNNSSEEVVECPLCLEPLEVDDLNFYPCTCGYQICRFCWHRIRTDENELCPACRKAYPENPADFTPLSQEQIAALKAEKRQRDQQRKQKITENRKHLANVRVVQKNLVFVVGLPPRLADAEILKKHEYFGKYGKIHKVVINPSTTYAGVQGPSASAYVTYVHNNDSLRAIQSVNNITIDSRLIKTSLGTTKYCSHFMKNQQCPKPDCMYLHELGDSEASFTKEEMHQGKHQEYEKRLHDSLIAQTAALMKSGGGPNGEVGGGGGSNAIKINGQKEAWPSLSESPVQQKMLGEGKGGGGGKMANGKKQNGHHNHHHHHSEKTKLSEKNGNSNVSKKNQKNAHHQQQQSKENNKNSQNKKGAAVQNHRTNSNNSNAQSGNQKQHLLESSSAAVSNGNGGKKQKQQKNGKEVDPAAVRRTTNAKNGKVANGGVVLEDETELDLIEDDIENDVYSLNGDECLDDLLEDDLLDDEEEEEEDEDEDHICADDEEEDDDSPLSVNTASSSNSSSPSSSSNLSGDSGTASESASGKSSPADNLIKPQPAPTELQKKPDQVTPTELESGLMKQNGGNTNNNNGNNLNSSLNNNSSKTNVMVNAFPDHPHQNLSPSSTEAQQRLANLRLFDDNNSSFFSTNNFQPYFYYNNNANSNNSNPTTKLDPNLASPSNNPQLPDLLNGLNTQQQQQIGANSSSNSHNIMNFAQPQQQQLGGLSDMTGSQQQPPPQLNAPPQTNGLDASDPGHWEAAFKYMMNNTGGGPAPKKDHQLQQQQQEELYRLQELHKRNLLNSMRFPAMQQHQQMPPFGSTNGLMNGNVDYDYNFVHNSNNLAGLSHLQQLQQQQQQQQAHTNSGNSGGLHDMYHMKGNLSTMSKFFDFHKNQQNQHYLDQQQQQHSLMMKTSQQQSWMNGGMAPPPSSSNAGGPPQPMPMHLQQHQQQQQGRFNTSNSSSSGSRSQPSVMDDDLGFDPFIETQKGLAELIERETVQSKATPPTTTAAQMNPNKMHDNSGGPQRPRMPPPGFNHMNSYGFGAPRAQGSKILPFMNQQQQQMQNDQSNWNGYNTSAANYQKQDPLMQNSMGGTHKGYGNINDWTSIDPAIVSFRQFPSFLPNSQQGGNGGQQQVIPPPGQPSDLYMQHQHQGFGNLNPMNLSQQQPGSQQQQQQQQQQQPLQQSAHVQGMLEFLKNRQLYL